MKFALSGFPERYTTPPRPSKGTPAVLDAHRQTQFLLSDDLIVFERAMNLQLEIVGSNQKQRTPPAAAMLAYWSRTFSHLATACASACTGSYVSVPPLLRTACECIATQRSLTAAGFTEWEEWAANAVSQSKERNALAMDAGRFRAPDPAADEAVGDLYHVLDALSAPHSGATLLQAAVDTNLQRAPISFAEGTFHLGWAEASLGWLVGLAGAQLETVAASGVFSLSDAQEDGVRRTAAELKDLLSKSRRCYVEQVDGGLLFHNYRRTATGQPKRVMLAFSPD